MRFFYVLFLFGVIKSTACISFVHDPVKLIMDAHLSCVIDPEVDADCLHSCALERSNMLSPQYDGVNAKEFSYYKKYADLCWKSLQTTVKPTCAQATQFNDCFINATKVAGKELIKECAKKFPVKDLKTVALNPESFANIDNFACFASCLWESVHAFKEDGSINVSMIYPHLFVELNGAEVVAKCEEDNKQASICERKANRYYCLTRAFAFEALQRERQKYRPHN